MSSLYSAVIPPKPKYRDSKFDGTPEEYDEALRVSATLYVGNLSFFTTEEQIYELFTRNGEVKQIIMGLHQQQLTPCGFCFVEYHNHADAEDAVRYINGTKLDDRIIRCDLDWVITKLQGFRKDRQFGRGRTGGQVRDEHRKDFDPARGGYGATNPEYYRNYTN